MGGTDGKTPNAMEGIMSMVLANMASEKSSVMPKGIDNMNAKEVIKP